MSKSEKCTQYYIYRTSITDCTPEQIQALKEMDAKDNATNNRESKHCVSLPDCLNDHVPDEVFSQWSYEPTCDSNSEPQSKLALLRQGLALLSEVEITVLTLQFRDGMSATDIASRQGVAVSTITRRSKSAQEKLRQYILFKSDR
jgi:DNA-directed RNA polymerase specialized sigma subunit